MVGVHHAPRVIDVEDGFCQMLVGMLQTLNEECSILLIDLPDDIEVLGLGAYTSSVCAVFGQLLEEVLGHLSHEVLLEVFVF